MPQVSSSSPKTQPGVSKEANTHKPLFSVPANFPTAKEIKGSIKVTVFLQLTHTLTHTHQRMLNASTGIMNDLFVNGAFKMRCMLLLSSLTFLQLFSEHMCLKQHTGNITHQPSQEVIFISSLLPFSQEVHSCRLDFPPPDRICTYLGISLTRYLWQ